MTSDELKEHKEKEAKRIKEFREKQTQLSKDAQSTSKEEKRKIIAENLSELNLKTLHGKNVEKQRSIREHQTMEEKEQIKEIHTIEQAYIYKQNDIR